MCKKCGLVINTLLVFLMKNRKSFFPGKVFSYILLFRIKYYVCMKYPMEILEMIAFTLKYFSYASITTFFKYQIIFPIHFTKLIMVSKSRKVYFKFEKLVGKFKSYNAFLTIKKCNEYKVCIIWKLCVFSIGINDCLSSYRR